jgi:hypothetical protein
MPQFVTDRSNSADQAISTFAKPFDGDYAQDVFCPHNRLEPDETGRKAIPRSAWMLLLDYIPGLRDEPGVPKPLTTKDKRCNTCNRELQMEQEEHDEVKREAKTERAAMRSLLSDVRTISTVLGQVRSAQGRRDEICLVSRKFMDVWKAWLGDPVGAVRPQGIDNADLICPHLRIRVDIDEPRAEQGFLSEEQKLFQWEKNEDEKRSHQVMYLHSSQPLRDSTPKYLPYEFLTKAEYDQLCKFYPDSIGPVK